MAASELKIEIPEPNIQLAHVKIKGVTPIIFHAFSEKAKRMILEKQQKKAPKAKEIRDPKAEYLASFYYNADHKIALPAQNIKQSMVSAGRVINGVTMALLKQVIFVVGDADGMIPVEFTDNVMREDTVTIGMGSTDLRYRGELRGWRCEFDIRWNGDVMSIEQVLNLLQTAGFSCGLGEWRPERGGTFGQFELDMEDKIA